MPWMVYIIISLVGNTVLQIVNATQYIAIKDTVNAAGEIIEGLIYLCK